MKRTFTIIGLKMNYRKINPIDLVQAPYSQNSKGDIHPSNFDILKAIYEGRFEERGSQENEKELRDEFNSTHYLQLIDKMKKFHSERVAYFVRELLLEKSNDYPIWVFQENDLVKIKDGQHRVIAAALVGLKEIKVSHHQSEADCIKEKSIYDARLKLTVKDSSH